MKNDFKPMFDNKEWGMVERNETKHLSTSQETQTQTYADNAADGWKTLATGTVDVDVPGVNNGDFK